jgi:hypothetical protein
MWSGCALRRENMQKEASVADAQQLHASRKKRICIQMGELLWMLLETLDFFQYNCLALINL